MKISRNVYICLLCTQVQTTETFPPPEGCKTGSFHHHWRKLGEEGKQRYHCKRCGCTVHLNVQPTSVGCSMGTLHDWKKSNSF